MMRQDERVVTVRYYAAARAAAGVAEDTCAAPTLAMLRTDLAATRGAQLEKVLSVASFLVDGLSWRDQHAPLPAGATVDVLPPFAGG
jgi:molybdopterin converting factor small subunit